MKNIINSIISSGLVLGALALGIATPSTANAQQLATANIPFSFQIGKTTLPAGNYSVDRKSSSTLQVQNIRSGESVFVITTLADKNHPQGPANISFNQYGDHYFLRQVEVSSNSAAYKCPKTRQEKALAHDMNIKNAPQVAINIGPQHPASGN